jgi:RNA polymerase sigma-70 factor (ECF subfamily)
MSGSESQGSPSVPQLFPPTQWSAIVAARDIETPVALAALERVARAYWQPLYVFLRQHGADHAAACDQVQGFFEHLLSGEVLRRVERRESRFRSFLLAVFQNWLVNQHDRAVAQKRGGGATQPRR